MSSHQQTLRMLYENPEECAGPYRVVTKLPQLPESLREHVEIDNVVADTLTDHADFVRDIALLTASALLQVHGPSAEISKNDVKGMAGQIATSLAVSLLRSQKLESALVAALYELGFHGASMTACPD